jgi:hypothetical protein
LFLIRIYVVARPYNKEQVLKGGYIRRNLVAPSDQGLFEMLSIGTYMVLMADAIYNTRWLFGERGEFCTNYHAIILTSYTCFGYKEAILEF